MSAGGGAAVWQGMRLLECLRLRTKEMDVVRGEIMVRDGWGAEHLRYVVRWTGSAAWMVARNMRGERCSNRTLATTLSTSRALNNQNTR
ncbi:hypothetical protein XFF7767_470002 [Xanthomonas citri pv. fuscans]|nr:hypothetical protein XFF7767_470002 [Xanthomonas citri pv. fuscans]